MSKAFSLVKLVVVRRLPTGPSTAHLSNYDGVPTLRLRFEMDAASAAIMASNIPTAARILRVDNRPDERCDFNERNRLD